MSPPVPTGARRAPARVWGTHRPKIRARGGGGCRDDWRGRVLTLPAATCSGRLGEGGWPRGKPPSPLEGKCSPEVLSGLRCNTWDGRSCKERAGKGGCCAGEGGGRGGAAGCRQPAGGGCGVPRLATRRWQSTTAGPGFPPPAAVREGAKAGGQAGASREGFPAAAEGWRGTRLCARLDAARKTGQEGAERATAGSAPDGGSGRLEGCTRTASIKPEWGSRTGPATFGETDSHARSLLAAASPPNVPRCLRPSRAAVRAALLSTLSWEQAPFNTVGLTSE